MCIQFLSKKFLGSIGYISSYLPKLEYVQWVSHLTPDPKIPGLSPTYLYGAFDSMFVSCHVRVTRIQSESR